MTMQTLSGGVLIPGITTQFLTTPTFQNALAMNDSDDKLGYIFAVPKSGNIRYIGFRTMTVTVGDTVKVSLYTTDATSGLPTSTAYGGMVKGTQVIANADDNVWFTVQLGTDAAATAGDIVAAVIEFDSFVAGNLQIATHLSQTGNVVFPYYAIWETAWLAGNSGIPVVYIKYSDNTVSYIPAVMPLSGAAVQNFTSATSPDEYALRFQLPFPARVSGFMAGASFAADTKFILYDSDGTSVLTSYTFDKDYSSVANPNHFSFRFASPQTILKNTFYRLAYQPQSAANATIFILTVPENLAMDQMAGGQNFHLSTRTDAGAWSNFDTQRPSIGLILDQFDDGTATGGALLTHPGMAGGMRA